MATKSRNATSHTSTLIYRLVKYLLVFSFTISHFPETSAGAIDGGDKDSFIEVGWNGAEDSKPFARPGEFRGILEHLDLNPTGNGVWVEEFEVTTDASNDKSIVYTFRPLGKEYCNINSARVTIKYFMHHAAASIFSCIDGGSEHCYLENPSTIEWKTQTFQLSIFNEIKIDMMLLSGGYIVFDHVIIEHDGDENDDCKTTTSEMTTDTEGITNRETTTGITEEQHETEGTDGTWIPVTSPSATDASTTIQPTFVTEPTATTEMESDEEVEDPIGSTTTEDPTSSTSSEDFTPSSTTENATPFTTIEDSSYSTTDGDPPTTSSVPSTTKETTITTHEPSTTDAEQSTFQSSTEIDLPTTTEGLEPCNHTCEYVGIDCHNYYTCINFKYKEFYTCRREQGLAFNPKLKVCDLMENVEECRNCTCEYFPHHDCKNYYYCPDVCNLDLCELRECPSGLLWSIDANRDGKGHQQCTLASDAICAPGTALKNNELLRYIKGPLTNDTARAINHA